MKKILKNRLKIKRKENLNKRFLFQLSLTLILVIGIMAIKTFGTDLTEEYLSYFEDKTGREINLENAILNVEGFFKDIVALIIPGDSTNDEYIEPVSGIVYKNYGLPITGEVAEYNHGIDIISETLSVKSSSHGNVIEVGQNYVMDNYIIVENNSKRFIYSMFDEIFVSTGDSVEVGDIIGKLKNEEKLLRIEIWEEGESINPMSLFNAN